MTDSFEETMPMPLSKSGSGTTPPNAGSSPVQNTEELRYTRVLYITPHTSLSTKIKVHDLTSSISGSSVSKEFSSEAEQLGKSLVDATPLYTLVRRGWWQPIPVYEGDSEGKTDDDAIATWKPSKSAVRSQKFSFPSSSPHSSHVLSMKRPSFRYHETFVRESVEYIWKFEFKKMGKTRRPITLWKKIGNQQTAVARFTSPFRMAKTGGTLIVNADEVDTVVALLTCCGILRKIRQRR